MKKKLLIIGFVWPEPKSSAAGSRMLQLIELFKQQEYDITFVSAANTSKNTFDLSALNVKTEAIILNDSSFDSFINKLMPDVVLFDRFMTEEQFGWRVSEQCPKAIKILDTEDFHGLRKARELAFKNKEDLTADYLQNTITKREVASIYRCDLSLMISEAEIKILEQQFKIDSSLLFYLPFLLEPITEADIETLPKFESREHFVTIGNFLHAPNYDAILHLKKHIWPLIRKALPKVQLHIYGAYKSQKVSQLHNEKEGFFIKGYADNANAVMKSAKICLAPLRFGAGLKGKLVDAMQNGTPCVMSNIAAEGMFGNLKPNGFINDNAEDFAEKAIQLYTDEKIWNEFQNNGFQIVNKRFDAAEFKTSFSLRLASLIDTLEQHRQSNFIGQLLQHHTLQSTKFMSKWIEAKNSSS